MATIREISEILSLSNQPDKLADMALDTLARVMDLECCWVQTISDRKQSKLVLAGERGFSPEIRREMAAMDMSHRFSEKIIGLGHKIVIPDLSNDGRYGLPSFRDTGYKWLVAVPLMTYRAHGILGTASPNRKKLHKDTADLIMTIGGMIATAFSRTHLADEPPGAEKAASDAAQAIKKESKAVNIKPEAPVKTAVSDNAPPPKPARRPDGAFHSHARKMENFRRSHH